MPNEWMLEAAQALLKSAGETEDLTAKGTMLTTAANLMGKYTEKPTEVEDEDE